MLNPRLIRLLRVSLLSAVCAAGTAMAIEHDFALAIEVTSRFTDGDGIEKSVHYSGDVLIRQGSLLIKADDVEVLAKAGPGKEIFIARGTPAIYQQTAKDGSVVKAMANEIRYQVEDRILTLDGTAELHQNSSLVKGESIRFDMQNEKVNARGDDTEGGRVTTIFQPAQPKTGNDSQPKQDDKENDGNP